MWWGDLILTTLRDEVWFMVVQTELGNSKWGQKRNYNCRAHTRLSTEISDVFPWTVTGWHYRNRLSAGTIRMIPFFFVRNITSRNLTSSLGTSVQYHRFIFNTNSKCRHTGKNILISSLMKYWILGYLGISYDMNSRGLYISYNSALDTRNPAPPRLRQRWYTICQYEYLHRLDY